jgi:hypothetical protein
MKVSHLQASSALFSGKIPPNNLNRRLSGPWNWSGNVGEKKNPLPKVKRFVGRPSYSLVTSSKTTMLSLMSPVAILKSQSVNSWNLFTYPCKYFHSICRENYFRTSVRFRGCHYFCLYAKGNIRNISRSTISSELQTCPKMSHMNSCPWWRLRMYGAVTCVTITGLDAENADTPKWETGRKERGWKPFGRIRQTYKNKSFSLQVSKSPDLVDLVCLALTYGIRCTKSLVSVTPLSLNLLLHMLGIEPCFFDRPTITLVTAFTELSVSLS